MAIKCGLAVLYNENISKNIVSILESIEFGNSITIHGFPNLQSFEKFEHEIDQRDIRRSVHGTYTQTIDKTNLNYIFTRMN